MVPQGYAKHILSARIQLTLRGNAIHSWSPLSSIRVTNIHGADPGLLWGLLRNRHTIAFAPVARNAAVELGGPAR